MTTRTRLCLTKDPMLYAYNYARNLPTRYRPAHFHVSRCGGRRARALPRRLLNEAARYSSTTALNVIKATDEALKAYTLRWQAARSFAAAAQTLHYS